MTSMNDWDPLGANGGENQVDEVVISDGDEALEVEEVDFSDDEADTNAVDDRTALSPYVLVPGGKRPSPPNHPSAEVPDLKKFRKSSIPNAKFAIKFGPKDKPHSPNLHPKLLPGLQRIPFVSQGPPSIIQPIFRQTAPSQVQFTSEPSPVQRVPQTTLEAQPPAPVLLVTVPQSSVPVATVSAPQPLLPVIATSTSTATSSLPANVMPNKTNLPANYFLVLRPNANEPGTVLPVRSQTATNGVPTASTQLIDQAALIDKLIEKRFYGESWTEELRTEIIRRGRPCPKFDNPGIFLPEQCECHFKNMTWLAGISEKTRWYCWPCLLFNPEVVWSWLPSLSNTTDFLLIAEKHEMMHSHMEACLRLKGWELRVKKKAQAENPEKLIEAVKKNRKFLKLLIQVICTMKKKIENVNITTEDYIDLMKLASSYDDEIEALFITETKDSNKCMANELVPAFAGGLLVSIVVYIRMKIMQEVKAANYACLILEDTSDVVDKSWIAVIIRFVSESGVIHERFVKFVEIGYDRSRPKLLRLFHSIVNELGCNSKLVGFTYSGTFIEPSEMLKFNQDIHSVYKTAKFFHYREHNLWRLICQYCSHLEYARGFFRCLFEFSDFFESTPNAISSFLKVDKELNPGNHVKSTRIVFDFTSGFVITIKNHYASFLKFLSKIVTWPGEFSTDAVLQASYFYNFLKRTQTVFFIILLSRIFVSVEDLERALEGSELNVYEWKLLAKRAVVDLIDLNKCFQQVVESASATSTENTAKVANELTKPPYLQWFREFIEMATTTVISRSQDEDITLLSIDSFKTTMNPPDENYKMNIISRLLVIMKYKDLTRLKCQADFFSKSSFFQNKTTTQSLQCMHEYDLTKSMPELYRFLHLMITIPVRPTDSVKTPAAQRVRQYTVNKTELNSSDALLWMEKDLIDNILQDNQFYEDVIDNLAKRTGVPDSTFKLVTIAADST